jgi:hypothetical protein
LPAAWREEEARPVPGHRAGEGFIQVGGGARGHEEGSTGDEFARREEVGGHDRDAGGHRFEEEVVFFGFAVLLMVFATIATILRRDLWFRVVAYPAALLLGGEALEIGVIGANGYEWRALWVVLPFLVIIALIGCAWMFLLNGVIPFCWRALRRPVSGR